MWFADIGEMIAWTVAAGLALVMALAVLTRRTPLGRLLSPVVQAPVAIGSSIAAVLLIAQATVIDTIADHGAPGATDWGVWAWFVHHRDGAVTILMKLVTLAGDIPQMSVLAIVASVLLWRAALRAEATTVLAAPIGAWMLIDGFKNLYDRPRPPVAEQLMTETNPALPSGHALGSIVVLGVLAAVIVMVTRQTVVRVGAVALATFGVVLIGVSRLYLGVHWFTDVMAGWLLGGAWLAVCVTALYVARRRRGVEQTAVELPWVASAG